MILLRIGLSSDLADDASQWWLAGTRLNQVVRRRHSELVPSQVMHKALTAESAECWAQRTEHRVDPLKQLNLLLIQLVVDAL